MEKSNIALKQDISDYWAKDSAVYDTKTVAKPEAEVAVYRNAFQRTLKPGPLKILDVGTGTGFLSLMLADMGHRVTGLDMTEAMMSRAERHAREAELPIEFRLGDAEALPFPDSSFDAVTCRWVLWTLPGQEAALREWFRVLKPGGQLLVFDGIWRRPSVFGWLGQRLKQLGILLHEGRSPFGYFYKKEIEQALPSAGGVTPDRALALFREVPLENVTLETLTGLRDVMRDHARFLFKPASSIDIFLIHGERGNEERE